MYFQQNVPLFLNFDGLSCILEFKLTGFVILETLLLNMIQGRDILPRYVLKVLLDR